MNFELNKKQKQKQQEFKAFSEKYIIPYADKSDEDELFPKKIIDKLAEKGYLGAVLAKEYGGIDLSPITFGLLCHELGRGSLSLISLLAVHGMVTEAIQKWGSQDQQKFWLPQLAKGEKLGAFGLTEPNIGSDPKSIETTAILDEDCYILNGKKKWTSCGQIADLFLIIAQVEGKPTAFLLEKNTLGLEIEPIKGMLGFRSAMLAQLHLNNCKIPKKNLIGRVGFGFSHIAGTALDHGRYCIAWGCIGLGQACLDACLKYTSTRKQFGDYLRKHQLIQELIANMITEVKAAKYLCYHAGYLKETGDPAQIMETSLAKYYASRMALRVSNDAVQIHGANGCSNEYPVQRYFRDAKITEIIEGSNQIQQIIISQHGYQQYLFTERFKNKIKR